MGIKKVEKKVKEKETSNEIKRKYIKLKKEVNQHNKLYYQDNKPKISDVEYDKIWKKLKEIEIKYQNLMQDFEQLKEKLDEMNKQKGLVAI